MNRIEIEEVEGVEAPRRARVDEAVETPAEKLERQLLGAHPMPADDGEPPKEGDVIRSGMPLDRTKHTVATDEAVIDAMKSIYDPEIPVNIYDLGLIYGVDVSPEGSVVVTMTLTTPHCPVAESMPAEVELRVEAVPGVRDAEVNLVWDPAWDPQKMSDDAKLELGML